ncbi:MAG: hypothetical protein O2857_15875 [Planctomycetota bacterium]|nr:hypothetical protein [Planctomycetota bacterium]
MKTPVISLPIVLMIVNVFPRAYSEPVRNQLQNCSFEEDWLVSDVLARRRWGLTARAEAGYAESDGKIDHWEVSSAWWNETVAHTGRRCVKLVAGQKLSQAVRVAMRSPRSGNPAGGQTDFQPLDPKDLAKLESRTVRGGVWIKAEGLPEGKARIVIASGKNMTEAPIPGGTYDWQCINVASPDPWAAANQMAITIECSEGALWADDAFLEEMPLGSNLAVNGNFEKLDARGWPQGYSQPEVFWWYRFDYYSWTGWSHDGGYGCQLAERIDLVPGYQWRGHAAVDTLLSHSGRNSLRLAVYPGDNFGVLGPPVAIDGTKPFEVGAWVRADRIHQVELMVVDPDSNRYVLMDTDHFAGLEGVGVMAGSKGQGTYEWTYLRKLICPKDPLKQIRPMIGVRGFDGAIVEKNHVGTVWVDDIEVIQRGGSALTPAPSAPVGELRVTGLDLGERLWGKNALTVTLSSPKTGNLELNLKVTSSSGKEHESATKVRVEKGKPMVAELSYEITELCRGWTEQYELEFLVKEGRNVRKSRLAFGTPSSLLSTRMSHQYLFPDEKLVAAANVQVSRRSLKEVSRLLLQVTNPQGKVVSEVAVDDPAERLPIIVPGASQALPYLNTSNVVTMSPDLITCEIRPWQEATRDYSLRLLLLAKDGAELARAGGMKFGRMTPFAPSGLKMVNKGRHGPHVKWEPTGKVSVNAEHFLLIDDKPFFPVYFGEYGDTFRPAEGINIDRDQIMCLGANPLLLTSEEKQKYGMEASFGVGEWDLNGMLSLTVEQVRSSLGKFRADNPGRLVVGGYDLVSHPGSRRADVAKYFLPAYDVLGVEASFASYVPNLKVDYFPAMQGSKCAILVGFEHYYFVPFEELRYRSYLSVMRGAAGLGLIPSRMMTPRPEQNNYLRGINAECRSLASVFAAPSPNSLTLASHPNLFTWERGLDGKRFLFVVRGEPFLTRGLFEWSDRKSPGGRLTHTEPRATGLSQHWAENTKVYQIAQGDTVIQELFIEGPAPKMIAMQFRTRTSVDHTWEHRAYWGQADMVRFRSDADYPADQKPPKPWPAWMVVESPPQSINGASERGAYYFEVLGGAACKAVDGQPGMKRMGEMPQSGEWITVRIPAAAVGLAGQKLDGLAFSVDGGKVSWGRTSLSSAGGEEVPLIDGSLSSLSVDPGQWTVEFTVPGERQIDTRVLFENARLNVTGNTFTDQFPVPYRARVYEIGTK